MRWRWQAKLANNPQSTNVLAAVTSSLAYMFVMLLRYPMLTMTSKDHQNHSFGNNSNSSRHHCFSSHATWHSEPAAFRNLSPKTMLVLAFTAGYAIGKLPAFLTVSKLPPWKRLRILLAIVLFSFVTIVCFFRCASIMLQSVFVFIGAIPLSWMFGVMTQYLEGRHATDKLNIGLSLVMLLGGGIARSIAAWMHNVMNNNWEDVPLMVAAMYLPICLISLVVLDTTPPPTRTEAELQRERRPLSMPSGLRFFRRYWPGLCLVFLGYAAASAVRNFREYFAADIYTQALHKGHHHIFNKTTSANVEPWEYIVLELPAAAITSVAIYSVSFVQSNRKALFLISGFVTCGAVICMLSTLCYTQGWFGQMPSNGTFNEAPPLSFGPPSSYRSSNHTNHKKIIPSPNAGYIWILTIGVGTYLMYLPGGFLMFDRLIAASRVDISAAFLIYASDIFGQFATFGFTFLALFGTSEKVETHHDFFIATINPIAVTMIVTSLLSIVYFSCSLRDDPREAKREDPASFYDDPQRSSSDAPEAEGLLFEDSPKKRRSTDRVLFYDCQLCSSRFSASGALRIHVQEMHKCSAWTGVATQVRLQIRQLELNKSSILVHAKSNQSNFSYKNYEPIATASLAESPQLAALFAECVPSKASTWTFWAGYATAVRKIKDEHSSTSIYRHRYNFDTDRAYEGYMQSLVSPGMRVLVRTSISTVTEGDIGTYCGVARKKVNALKSSVVEVEFEGAEVKLVELTNLEVLEGASVEYDYD